MESGGLFARSLIQEEEKQRCNGGEAANASSGGDRKVSRVTSLAFRPFARLHSPALFSSLAFTCVAGEAVSFNSFPSSIRASGEQHSWPCLREGTSFPFVFPCSLPPPGGRPPTHPKDQR